MELTLINVILIISPFIIGIIIGIQWRDETL